MKKNFIKYISINKYIILSIIFVVVWCIYNFSILLKTGFVGDDAYNSMIKGAIINQDISLNDRILSEIKGWTFGAGRIMIFSWYFVYGIFYLTHSTILVKSLTIFTIIIGVIYFYFFTKEQTKSKDIAFLSSLLIGCFIQFRYWHDPVLIFPSHLMPMIIGLLMPSLYYFSKYLNTKKNNYLIVSASLYTISIFFYEITVPLCIMFVVLALKKDLEIKNVIRKSKIFLLLAAFYISFVFYIKFIYMKFIAHTSTSYPTFAKLSLPKFFYALKIQLLSSLPLNYFINVRNSFAIKIDNFDYAYLALFGLIIAFLIKRIAINKNFSLANWIFASAILFLLPAIITALSSHQQELIDIGPGFGYIPVYLQYFGLCALIVSLIAFIAIRIKSKITLIIFSIVIGISSSVIAGINLGLNRTVAMAGNPTYKYPTDLLWSAMDKGIFSDLTNKKSMLFRHMRYTSDYFWSYTTITGKIIHTCELSDINQKAIDGTDNYKDCLTTLIKNLPSNQIQTSENKILLNLKEEDTWTLSYNLDKKEGQEGRVILAKIDEIEQNKKTGEIVKMNVTKIKIYDLKTNTIKNVDLKKKPMDFMDLIKNESYDYRELTNDKKSIIKNL